MILRGSGVGRSAQPAHLTERLRLRLMQTVIGVVLATLLIHRGNEAFRCEIHQSEESFGCEA